MQPETPTTESPTPQASSSPTLPAEPDVVPQPTADSKQTQTEPLIEPGEKLISVVRRHPIGLFAIYLGAGVAIAAVITLYVFVSSDKVFKGFSSSASGAVGLALIAALLLLVVLAVMVRVYKQSKLVVTDKSLIQVLQKGLFSRKISRLSMSNVEDVNAEKSGIFQTILNYGTLTIETAGEEDNFIFPWCPDPDAHADSILKARQQYVQKYGDLDHPHA